jgi:NADP-reducing hydrogenase subunit HndC
MLDFCVKESCGKCPPCRIGTKVLLGLVTRLCEGDGQQGDLETIQRLGEHVQKTSLCGLGQSAPTPVLTALKHFRSEFEAHLEDRTCPARECCRLLDLRIDHGACEGCGDCVAVCPEQAISGELGADHFIDLERCTRCGLCIPSCPYDAIETV